MNTKGDAAIGSYAKIIKTTKEEKKPSLIGILLGIIGLIGSIIAIYLLLKSK